VQMITP